MFTQNLNVLGFMCCIYFVCVYCQSPYKGTPCDFSPVTLFHPVFSFVAARAWMPNWMRLCPWNVTNLTSLPPWSAYLPRWWPHQTGTAPPPPPHTLRATLSEYLPCRCHANLISSLVSWSTRCWGEGPPSINLPHSRRIIRLEDIVLLVFCFFN